MHVVVVGAGIVGLAAARELAVRGATVTVLERHLAGAGTSSRGEGNILVSDKEIPAEARLALRSLELWAAFAEDSPEPFEFEAKGGIVTASSRAQLDLLAAQAARQAPLGICSTVLDGHALREAEPHLSPALVGGIAFPQDAQVMPIHAVRALRRACLDLGVVERAGVEVVGLDRVGDGLRVRLASGEAVEGDAVVNAAGPWGGALARVLGGRAAVFPRRGMLLVTEPLPPGTVRHKVYDGRYVEAVASDDAAAQVAPVIESTPSGTILVGSTREAVGWDARVRWDLAGALARDAATLFPALGRAQVIRTYQGFRPATPDHLPLIGPDAEVPGLFHCTGHEGAGIGLAMGSAEVLAAAVLDGVVDPELDPRRASCAGGAEGRAGDDGAVQPDLALDGSGGGAGCIGGAGDGEGSTRAASLLLAGVPAWRRTRFRDRPRGLFCGIGHCHDCVLAGPDGSTVRACLPTPRATVVDEPAPTAVDVLVIGAGPGGLAAATAAARGGRSVALVDRYDRAGGQIGRQPAAGALAGPWAEQVAGLPRGVAHLAGTGVAVLRRRDDGRIEALLETDGRVRVVRADAVVLATGAREAVEPFPGWTLPGVVTAGALQALLKREGRSPWRRVGLAGSGPLLLAVADAARAHDVELAFVLERQPVRRLASEGAAVAARFPAKSAQFARLVAPRPSAPRPPRFGWQVVEALGDAQVEAAVVADRRGRRRTVRLDALAVSHRLVPDVALALQLGCAVEPGADGVAAAVRVDHRQRTSVPGVLAVGEVTGVGGAEKSVAEGQLAGAVLAGAPAEVLDPLAEAVGRWRGFAEALERLYPWSHAWAERLPDEEVVCRCEEVPMGAIRRAVADGATTARAVKGLTRCGMGRCQGAVCGPVVTSALRAAGCADPGDLEQRPLATPLAVSELARVRAG